MGEKQWVDKDDRRHAWLVIVVGAVLIAFLVVSVVCPAALCAAYSVAGRVFSPPAEAGSDWYVGLVRDSEFEVWSSRGLVTPSARLTRMPMQAAMAPESEEIDLRPYEGRVILLRGQGSGGWIYSVRVTVKAGPVASWLLRKAWSQGE